MTGRESKHLLMIVHRIPFPPDKGDKIRSWNELCFLKNNGWNIHLCTFVDDAEDWKHVEELRRHCATLFVGRQKKMKRWLFMALALFQGAPLSVGAFFDRKALGYVSKVLKTYSIRAALCFCSPTAEYFFRLPPLEWRSKKADFDKNWSLKKNAAKALRPLRIVMDLCDVDSEKWRIYSKKVGGWKRWIYEIEAERLRSYEIDILHAFDASVVVSQAEADFLKKSAGVSKKVFAVSNGVDTDYFHPEATYLRRRNLTRPPRIVFCGVMDYHPNIDAVEWFVEEVMPILRKSFGKVEFDIVGSKPVRRVLKLAGSTGVRVLGRVDDVRPYVWKADVSVAPVRIARGIQNKVLEAMAMGKPVVATNEAFEGIEGVPGQDLMVSDAVPLRFADAVSRLVENEDFAKRMGEKARETILRRYSWDTKLVKLDRLLLQ